MNIVHPYSFNITADEVESHTGVIPATQLSSTIQSLSVLLSMFINNGAYNGTQILQPKKCT